MHQPAEAVFQPEELAAMSAAYEAVITARPNLDHGEVAQRIMSAARKGILDPTSLANIAGLDHETADR